jgi:hypothetical protein
VASSILDRAAREHIPIVRPRRARGATEALIFKWSIYPLSCSPQEAGSLILNCAHGTSTARSAVIQLIWRARSASTEDRRACLVTPTPARILCALPFRQAIDRGPAAPPA